MNKLKVKAVIFDLGSTLIEYEAISWDELGAICMKNVRKSLLKGKYDIPDESEFLKIFDKIKLSYRKKASESLTEWTVPQLMVEFLDNLKIEHNQNLIDKLFEAYYLPVTRQIYGSRGGEYEVIVSGSNLWYRQ